MGETGAKKVCMTNHAKAPCSMDFTSGLSTEIKLSGGEEDQGLIIRRRVPVDWRLKTDKRIGAQPEWW
eukprot:scaffold4061_cov163-Amphora_coffeaeformis.AAC.3